VCLGVTSKQARVALECCHGVQGWKWRYPLTCPASLQLPLPEVTPFLSPTKLSVTSLLASQEGRDISNRGHLAP